ncbi:MAG: type II secretion system minor pseudopilin GspI [Gammaproteobacteria bacterium]|nr:type II secretion system minor pseudopilin GspI [Gammaproteobacteria bacterium]
MKLNKQSGFTLFEVMIALAILATTMVAAIMTADNVLHRTVNIEKKLLAHWVGMNILNSMQLKLLPNKLEVTSNPIAGKSSMRGQDFEWKLKITQQNLADIPLLNMQVTVLESEDHAGNKKNVLDVLNRSSIKN